MISFRCNSEHECSILADSDIFGGDPCHGVPKYLEVYFGCFQGMFMFHLFFFHFKLERTYLFLLSCLYYNGVWCMLWPDLVDFLVWFFINVISKEMLSCNFLTLPFLKRMQSLLSFTRNTSGPIFKLDFCQNSQCNCTRLCRKEWPCRTGKIKELPGITGWKAVFGEY